MKKTYKYISFIIFCQLILSICGAKSLYGNVSNNKMEIINSINIFAGNDTSICQNAYLGFSELGAYISGDVSDGNWFTYGDGSFSTSSGSAALFSTTLGYNAGAQDIANGYITLILVSDDPDGIGPLTEVSDEMVVTLTGQPPLACNSFVNLSLDNNCMQVLQIEMLLTNPIAPYNYYEITSYDEDGEVIVDNVLTADHIGQNINYTIGHLCGEITCNGIVSVEDYHIPNLICFDQTIKCNESFHVNDIGLPIPVSATIQNISGNTYTISNFDPCSDVILTYSDAVIDNNCSELYTKVVTRFWEATDASGNSTSCTQLININRISISEVVLPLHYNDIDLPSLQCGTFIDTLDNGAPALSVTGEPQYEGCLDIDVIFEDKIIPACGNSFKVIRKWFVFDNCTNESLDYNQLIKVSDTLAPELICTSDTIVLGVDPYNCEAAFEVPALDYSDCSEAIYEVSYLEGYTGDTIPTGSIFTTENIIFQGDSLYIINHLTLGNTWLKYTYMDQCNNKSYCYKLLQIEDKIVPFAACKAFIKVSVLSDGTARMLAESADNGSWDNCTNVSFEIRKMTDICNLNSGNFAPYVNFCCEEIGSTIMVMLRITDEYGNYNNCMVEVEVDDKIPPVINAPSDVTISCTNLYNPDDLSNFGNVVLDPNMIQDIVIYDAINNGSVGTDGLATDNCNITLSEQVEFDLNCEQGTITRIFTATDNQGLLATDSQVITIINPDPFVESNITWPSDVTYNGCINLEVDTSEYPIFTNVFCALVSATYEDQIFDIVPDACTKIRRHWTVVDWCQYNSDTNEGIWDYYQTIKVINNVAPEFISTCVDTSYCLFEEDCGDGNIVLNILAEDDCTPQELLNYSWDIRSETNELILNGIGNNVEIDLNAGAYQVFWEVEDKCGNKNNCNYSFEVKDCKAPTPYCIGNIVSTLMNNNTEIEIWALDFDLNSSDNCTTNDDLIFSFSADTMDQFRIYNCDSIDNGIAQSFELEMWVTDEYGNQDNCTVQFIVQDNQDLCEDEILIGAIGGQILNPKANGVENVNIDFQCAVNDYTNEVYTDSDGGYIDAELLNGVNHIVKPNKNDDFKNGVSTLDLILIQRHILKLKKFTDPYKLIAADVNNSESISVVDLIHLKKLLLGKYKSYPNNDSWRFVDANFEFEDITAPWEFPDSIEVVDFDNEYLLADFVGVKIGDVDFNNQFEQITSNISRNGVELEQICTTLTDGTINCQIRLPEEYNYNGFQLKLNFDIDKYEFVDIGNEGITNNIENFNFDELENGSINCLWFTGLDPVEHRVLIDLNFKVNESTSMNSILSLEKSYNNEIYVDDEALILSLNNNLTFIEERQVEPVISVFPNPFSDELLIDFSEWKVEEVLAKIFSIDGRLLYENQISTTEMTTINTEVLLKSGSYLLSIISKERTLTKKIVKI